jgi:hypothetical protein
MVTIGSKAAGGTGRWNSRSGDLPFRPLDGRGRQVVPDPVLANEPVLECLPGGSCGLAGSEFGDRLAGVLAELLAGHAPAG